VVTLSMRRREKLYLKGTEDKTLISGNWEKLKEAHTVMGSIRLGKSHYTIAIEMGIPTHKVRTIAKRCMEEFCEDIQSTVASERAADLVKIDALIEQFMPIAQSTTVDVQKVTSRGESYTDSEWKHCVSAGELVLKALEARAKLFGYQKVEAPVTNNYNHAFFTAGPSADVISKICDGQPSEIQETSSDPVVEISFDS
jgi:hypothetical protein